MAEMGEGYGSECHLLRYLGRHRNYFDEKVQSSVGADAVRWIDFHFDPTKRWLDGERKGVDFLPPDHPAVHAWTKKWPQRGNPPNWDAIGVVTINGRDEWLLVEAKAHLGEMRSDCHAKEEGGLSAIRTMLADLKADLGIAADRDWLMRHYQYANRLAVLNLLAQNGAPARLLFIYFLCDRERDGNVCPKDSTGWEKALQEQSTWLGLEHAHKLSDRIHKMFLPTVPAD
jgi:hypothetical protein